MTELILLIVLALVGAITMLAIAHGDPSFFQNFWPNFFSDLFVGIAIAGFISWFLARSRKVAAEIIAIAKNPRGLELELEIAVQNTGRVSFNPQEVYSHLYLDKNLYILKVNGRPQQQGEFEKDETGSFYYNRYMLPLPVFPSRSTTLFTLLVRAPKNGKYDIYWYLSTAHGMFPKRLRQDKQGVFDKETMGKLVIPVQDESTT